MELLLKKQVWEENADDYLQNKSEIIDFEYDNAEGGDLEIIIPIDINIKKGSNLYLYVENRAELLAKLLAQETPEEQLKIISLAQNSI